MKPMVILRIVQFHIFFLGINLSLILGDYYFSQVDRKIRLRLNKGEGHEKNNINDNDHTDDRRRSSDGFSQWW